MRTVRLPLNKLSLLKDISKASRRLGQGREEEPDVREIASELDLPADVVTDAILSARPVSSLDGTFEDDDKRSLLNVLADTSQKSPDTDVMRDSAREQLESVLESLDDREQRIIRLYFGLDGKEALTLEQIGSLIGVTRERVRQIKERAPESAPTPVAVSVSQGDGRGSIGQSRQKKRPMHSSEHRSHARGTTSDACGPLSPWATSNFHLLPFVQGPIALSAN